MAAHGSCYCGAVELQLEESARPVMQSLCHCRNCRHWSAAPVTSVMMYATSPKPDAPFWPLTVSDPSHAVRSFYKKHSPEAGVWPCTRYFCSQCGGHLFNTPEGASVVAVFPYCWERDSSPFSPAVLFEPSCHVNSKHTAISISDGKPRHEGFAHEGATSEKDQDGSQQQVETQS